MISKEKFSEFVKSLIRDSEYSTKINDLCREYNQENSYCFVNHDTDKAMSVLMRYALDDVEWMYDCVWDFILSEGKPMEFFMDEQKTKITCSTPEELYDFFILEVSNSKQ